MNLKSQSNNNTFYHYNQYQQNEICHCQMPCSGLANHTLHPDHKLDNQEDDSSTEIP